MVILLIDTPNVLKLGLLMLTAPLDVEFLDNLCVIFDVPARQGELLVDQL
jgi:hypothetical protein